MRARDDYPALHLMEKMLSDDIRPEVTRALDELDRLREWKIDASAALDQYEDYRASIEAAMQKALEIR